MLLFMLLILILVWLLFEFVLLILVLGLVLVNVGVSSLFWWKRDLVRWLDLLRRVCSCLFTDGIVIGIVIVVWIGVCVDVRSLFCWEGGFGFIGRALFVVLGWWPVA